MKPRSHSILRWIVVPLLILLTNTGCETTEGPRTGAAVTAPGVPAGPAQPSPPSSLTGAAKAEDFLVVDCLLPGQVRKLGSKMTNLTPRRAVKIPAMECEIRGGEYVAFDRSDLKSALSVWLSQAQAGDSQAQVYVAEIYEKGLGTEPNNAEAAKWYEKAAVQGSSRAQVSLGYLYEKGLGVPADPKKALEWYRRAAGAKEGVSFDLEATSAKDKEELEALRREVERRKQETIALRRQIDQKERQLAGLRGKAQTQARELNRLKQDVEQNRDALVQQTRKELPAAGDKELSALRTQLSQREAELQRRKQEAEELRKKMAAAEQQATTAQTNLQAASQNSKESEELKRQLEESRRQVQQLQLAMKQKENEISMERAGFERAQHDWEQQRTQLGQTGSDQLKRMEQALREKEKKYAEQQQALGQMQEQLGKLEQEATDYKVQLTEINQSSSEISGPTIDIIEPKGMTTRGVRIIAEAAGQKGTELIGKVNAPAGLYTFKVNGQDQTVEKNGMFRATLPALRGGSEPVELVAVDVQGKSTAVKLALQSRGPEAGPAETGQTPTDAPVPTVTAADFGPYHALVIGNNQYGQFPRLDTAVSDAQAVDKVLRERYGFQTQLLLNASRYDILSALNKYREKLTEKDNFLLYYAGHGELEKVNLRGYWLPVDAEPGSTANWISNVAVTDILNTISAKQVLVIADSCYSGTLTRSAIAHLEAGMSEEAKNNWLKLMAKRRARTVLSSGELKPVLDAGGGGHSVFAKALLEVLRANKDILEGRTLYREVSARVAYAADRYGIEQVPTYGPIQHAGHEAGDFFLVPAR